MEPAYIQFAARELVRAVGESHALPASIEALPSLATERCLGERNHGAPCEKENF